MKIPCKAFLLLCSVEGMLRRGSCSCCFAFVSVRQSWDGIVKLAESTQALSSRCFLLSVPGSSSCPSLSSWGSFADRSCLPGVPTPQPLSPPQLAHSPYLVPSAPRVHPSSSPYRAVLLFSFEFPGEGVPPQWPRIPCIGLSKMQEWTQNLTHWDQGRKESPPPAWPLPPGSHPIAAASAPGAAWGLWGNGYRIARGGFCSSKRHLPNPCAAFNCIHNILFILKFQVALKGRQEVLVKKGNIFKRWRNLALLSMERGQHLICFYLFWGY